MKDVLRRLLMAAVLVAAGASFALAQGTSSSISGVVVDSAGGAIPGASVVISSDATGTKFETVTNGEGAFSVPSLPVGTYKVTASLAGFKTAEVIDVRVQLGVPTNVKATLEVGALKETVTVTGAAAELINTQTATVSATMNMEQIAQIPMPTREVLNAVTFLVGVNQTGIARGEATVNGLPESFLDIKLDGVSNQDTFNKSTDGFFSPVRPRQDAIEAVTVTSAAGGADVGGSGAISINFVTRSGTQPLQRQRLRVLPRAGAEHELLVQHARRQPEERRPSASVRRPPGRTDRHPGPVRRPQQGVLLRARRRAAAAERRVARPHDAASARAAGLVPLQRDGRRAAGDPRGERARSGARQRPDLRPPIRS